MITSEWIEARMNTIINDDCLNVMKQVPDKYFDLVLTDPPYGIDWKPILYSSGAKKGKLEKNHNHFEWDVKTPSITAFEEIERVSKKQLIWGANYFNCFTTGGALVWYKNRGAETLSDCEIASVSWQKKVGYVKKQALSGFVAEEKNYHPTQKPLKLIEFCLEYAKAETTWKVFDPFMGSGATAVACQSLGLDWCGCELDPDYVAIANKRLEKVQGSLF